MEVYTHGRQATSNPHGPSPQWLSWGPARSSVVPGRVDFAIYHVNEKHAVYLFFMLFFLRRTGFFLTRLDLRILFLLTGALFLGGLNLLSIRWGARSTTSLFPFTLTNSALVLLKGKAESVVSFVGRYMRGDSYVRPSIRFVVMV